ncbi:MAG: hypothetical protein KIT33_04340 [Candidatus Kapabacteria bacterium]|nr:hypothetical protein [Ignavibacteriota bacterium]MCW5884185.1 hypothetical protein [Candidatus Kapabacteria bacterium]
MDSQHNYSDSELYSRLRKYLPRSFAGDSYASKQIKKLSEIAKKKNPKLYQNALDDALADISENNNLYLGKPIEKFFRIKYTGESQLDEYFSLFKTDITSNLKHNDFIEFCRRNNLVPDNLMLFPIEGNSMINAGINSGDTAIVDITKIPVNGDIGAVYINNKYFIKRIGGVGGRLKLISENPDFQPYMVGPEDDFKYIGLVTNIIKKVS